MRVPRGYIKRLPPTSFRLSPELAEALAAEEARTGETRTQVVERLLTKGLKMENTLPRYTIKGDRNGETITISVIKVPDGYTAELDNRDEYTGGVRATKDDVVDDIGSLWGRDVAWDLTEI